MSCLAYLFIGVVIGFIYLLVFCLMKAASDTDDYLEKLEEMRRKQNDR